VEQPNEQLMGLGRAIRDAQDALPPQGAQDFDPRLLEVRARRPRRLPRILIPSLAFAAVAMVAALSLRPHAITFQVANHQGVIGAWIAPDKEDLPLQFSDGSRVVLEKAAQARVERTDAVGARISLERGQVNASIVHREGTRWSVVAGPFTATVLGTQFTLGWDPQLRQMDLILREGEVALSGPVVGEERRVRQGETLRVYTREGRLEVRPASAQEPAQEPEAVVTPHPIPSAFPSAIPSAASLEPRQPASPRGRSAPRLASANEPRPAHEPARWRMLAEANRSHEALTAATDTGFDGICHTADASELRLLGDTARLAGKPQFARRAFESMRTRFEGSDDAAVAAFLLGKLSFDNLKSFSEAADWFSMYLAERPQGPLAREAAGRLIEARRKSGDETGARTAARGYLARYPTGPHATLARRVAGE
jgi:transmembrane sensor